MQLLKTDQGYISTRWIISIRQRAQGDFTVTYSNGAGGFEAVCSGADGHRFIEQFAQRPSA